MNITVVAPYAFLPAKMGGQRAIAFLYDHIGIRTPVTIAGTDNNADSKSYHFSVARILGRSVLRYANPLLYFRLRKLMKANNSDHLVLVHPYYAWLGWLLKHIDGKHLSVQTQNIESERFKSFGKWWWPVLWQYEKAAHRLADENLFITEEDREYGINKFGLQPEKCHTITYGFEMREGPAQASLQQAKATLRNMYSIPSEKDILFFNGSLDYAPNVKAIEYIIEHIVPGLKKLHYNFTLIICGKGLPERFNGLKDHKEIIYAGFVDDISLYFKGADIFINPVIEGGGIKTKLVEALGFNLSAVSTVNGAYGIPEAEVGEKLLRSPDHDWIEFCYNISAVKKQSVTPKRFYDYFYWGNIAEKAINILERST